MIKSSTRLRQSLSDLNRERRALLRRLTALHEVAKGSVSVVNRKCGKPNCHCAYGEGHPQTLFLFKADDGRRHCKLVRQADSVRLLAAGKRYREFRENLRKLRAIYRQEGQILVALMEMRALNYE